MFVLQVEYGRTALVLSPPAGRENGCWKIEFPTNAKDSFHENPHLRQRYRQYQNRLLLPLFGIQSFVYRSSFFEPQVASVEYVYYRRGSQEAEGDGPSRQRHVPLSPVCTSPSHTLRPFTLPLVSAALPRTPSFVLLSPCYLSPHTTPLPPTFLPPPLLRLSNALLNARAEVSRPRVACGPRGYVHRWCHHRFRRVYECCP